VDFVAPGYRVGMKGRELEAVDSVDAPTSGEVAP
jgi:hypothetical protein